MSVCYQYFALRNGLSYAGPVRCVLAAVTFHVWECFTLEASVVTSRAGVSELHISTWLQDQLAGACIPIRHGGVRSRQLAVAACTEDVMTDLHNACRLEMMSHVIGLLSSPFAFK
jgi:hypothetical protein